MREVKEEVIVEALGTFIVNVVNKGDLASPEEITALPGVARVLLDFYCSGVSSLPRKKS